MTDKRVYELVGEATRYSDRDAFVSDAALSECQDLPASEDIPAEIVEQCGLIWDAVNVPFVQLREKMGLTQAQMAMRLCVSKRTLENWEYRNNCPVHIRVLIFRAFFGLSPND